MGKSRINSSKAPLTSGASRGNYARPAAPSAARAEAQPSLFFCEEFKFFCNSGSNPLRPHSLLGPRVDGYLGRRAQRGTRGGSVFFVYAEFTFLLWASRIEYPTCPLTEASRRGPASGGAPGAADPEARPSCLLCCFFRKTSGSNPLGAHSLPGHRMRTTLGPARPPRRAQEARPGHLLYGI